MKKFLLMISMCFGISAFSQNLQFSRVFTLTSPGVGGINNSGMVVWTTVPAGKIWKLEFGQCQYCTLNGTYGIPTTGGSSYQIPSPFWFNSGDVIYKQANVNSILNIIEYTIVP